MTTFNSISEIVNTVANFKKEPFILVPSYTGEYIPNWGNTIDEDRYYHGDPMDTNNIYNNIQPAAYEDYDLSYLHK